MARARNKAKENEAANEAAEIAAVEAALNGDTEAQTKADFLEDISEDVDIAAVEAALNGEGDVALEINDSDFADVDEDALSAAIEADDAKSAAYKDAKSTIDVNDDEAPAKETTATKAKRGAAVGKTRDMGDFVAAVKTILGDDAILDSEEGPLDEEQLAQAMHNVTQIKVREKVVNLLQHVTQGASLSVYTKIAAELLVKAQLDGCKPLSLADIKKAYEAKGYKSGTVNAQAGQMMVLFSSLSMAKRGSVRGILEPNPNSVILDALASS